MKIIRPISIVHDESIEAIVLDRYLSSAKLGPTMIFDDLHDIIVDEQFKHFSPVVVIYNINRKNTDTALGYIKICQFLFNVPFVLLTGMRQRDILPLIDHMPNIYILHKPYTLSQLHDVLSFTIKKQLFT